MAECIFCKIAAGEIPADTVLERDGLLVFKDIQPKAPVHVLVIPTKHVETVDDLSDGDESLAGRMVLAARDAARQLGVEKDGYRLVMNCRSSAGQEVFHIHLHLLAGRPMGAMG